MNAGRFDGKAVLVSGAASGFGRAAAERLAREGARLVLCDIDAAGLEICAGICRDSGAEIHSTPDPMRRAP